MRRFAPAAVLLVIACSRSEPPKPIVAAPEKAAPSSTSAPTSAPTLTYEEGAITFAYWPSGIVRVTVPTSTATRSCKSELGENGNIWTKTDLQTAFDDPVVQAALANNDLYKSSYPPRARLVASKGTITWVNAWKELPPPEPPAVHHLQEVLHVLLTNRASLCT